MEQVVNRQDQCSGKWLRVTAVRLETHDGWSEVPKWTNWGISVWEDQSCGTLQFLLSIQIARCREAFMMLFFFYCCCFCLFIFGYQRTCTWPAGTCVIELNPWPPWFCLKLILPRWLEMISGHFLWNLWFEVPVNHVCFLVSMAGDTYGYFLLLLALCGIVVDPWLPET